VVLFRDHTKQRHSTFFDNQEQAEAYAAQKRNQVFEEGLKSLALPDMARHEATLAVALLEPYGKGILQAAQFYVQHLKETEKNCTVAELIEKYLWDMEGNNLRERHLRNTRQQLGQFAQTFGAQVVGKVTREDIEHWLRKNPWGAVTKANHLRGLKTFFKFACKLHYAKVNPAADIRPPKAEEIEIEIYTVEELKGLLREASPRILPFIAIGAFAGLRTAELRNLDWAQVNLEEGYIEVKAKTAKTRQRRIIPISDNLKAWLLPLAKPEGLVLQGMKESALYDAAHDAARKSGEPFKKNALRHSFGSYREAQLRDVARVASEMGNSPGIVYKHYRVVVSPKNAEAFWGLYPEPKTALMPASLAVAESMSAGLEVVS